MTKSVAKDSREFVIHVPSEYDYRYCSEHMEEIIQILKEIHLKYHNKILPLYGVPEPTLQNYVTTKADRKKNIFKIPDEKFRIPSENLLTESHNPVGDELPDLRAVKAAQLYSRTEESKHVAITEFKVTRAEAKGAYEEVYLAEHVSTNLIFSMKLLRCNDVLDTDKITREIIIAEVKKNSGCLFLSAPEYVYQAAGCLYLFFKRMMGKDLGYVLNREKRFTERKAQFYAAQVALALSHLHRNGIIYRDLRPENVLIDEEGYISLNDFGIYRFVGEDKKRALMNATAVNFPRYQEYLPPEHFVPDKEITKAADWWSLGVLLYEMLVGITPFYSRDLHILKQQIASNPVTYPDPMKHHILISDWAKDIISKVLSATMIKSSCCPSRKPNDWARTGTATRS